MAGEKQEHCTECGTRVAWDMTRKLVGLSGSKSKSNVCLCAFHFNVKQREKTQEEAQYTIETLTHALGEESTRKNMFKSEELRQALKDLSCAIDEKMYAYHKGKCGKAKGKIGGKSMNPIQSSSGSASPPYAQSGAKGNKGTHGRAQAQSQSPPAKAWWSYKGKGPRGGQAQYAIW